MALSGTWTSDWLQRPVSLIVPTATYTFAGWGKTHASGSSVVCLAGLVAGSNVSTNPYWGLTNYKGTVYFNQGASNVTASVTFVNDGNWHHYVGIIRPDRSKEIWIDGAQQTVTTSSTTITDTTATTLVVGNIGGPSTSDAMVAETCIWLNDALTAPEIVALANGASPATVRPLGLSHYTPLRGNFYEQSVIKPSALAPTSAALAPTFTADHPNVAHYRYRHTLWRSTAALAHRRPFISVLA